MGSIKRQVAREVKAMTRREVITKAIDGQLSFEVPDSQFFARRSSLLDGSAGEKLLISGSRQPVRCSAPTSLNAYAPDIFSAYHTQAGDAF
jgi:hypothetical protein